nr:MAG TPA: hypothetical protein [Caudoviricetes sp.]DAJ09240.1 MAG TPA: hypothetical protein [Caudoviricetes sp.]
MYNQCVIIIIGINEYKFRKDVTHGSTPKISD